MKVWTPPLCWECGRRHNVEWTPPSHWRWRQFDTEEAWLDFRLDKIGTSELSAAAGLSLEYSSPWGIWHRISTLERTPRDAGPLAAMGHLYEPLVAKLFQDAMPSIADLHGCQLLDPGDYFVVQHPNLDWLFCTPDRLLVQDGSVVGVVEIKTAYHAKAATFSDSLPMEYRVQVNGQLAVLDLPVAYYAVLLWGCDFRWYAEHRHDKLIASLVRKAGSLMEYVESGTPPPVDYSSATSRAIASTYPNVRTKAVDLPEECTGLHRERDALVGKLTTLEQRKVAIDNQLKAAIGDAEVGVLPDGVTAYSWKPTKRGNRVLKPTTLKGAPHGTKD
jgi:predicted phage-related endonuclease